eukprot:385001_1
MSAKNENDSSEDEATKSVPDETKNDEKEFETDQRNRRGRFTSTFRLNSTHNYNDDYDTNYDADSDTGYDNSQWTMRTRAKSYNNSLGNNYTKSDYSSNPTISHNKQ